MTPAEWLERFPEAAAALRDMSLHLTSGPTDSGSEKRVENDVVLAAARNGAILWRNNKGAAEVKGAFLRWGLANRTKQESDTFASADLIGILPVVVTPDMVGQTIGQFYSVEVKKPGGRIAQAQHNWAALVTARGGKALIIDDPSKLP